MDRGTISSRGFYKCQDYATSMPLLGNSSSYGVNTRKNQSSSHFQKPYPHSPNVSSPNTFSPLIQSPGFQSPGFQSPGFQSPNLQSPLSDIADLSFLDPLDLVEDHDLDWSEPVLYSQHRNHTRSTENIMEYMTRSPVLQEDNNDIIGEIELELRNESFDECSQLTNNYGIEDLKLNTIAHNKHSMQRNSSNHASSYTEYDSDSFLGQFENDTYTRIKTSMDKRSMSRYDNIHAHSPENQFSTLNSKIQDDRGYKLNNDHFNKHFQNLYSSASKFSKIDHSNIQDGNDGSKLGSERLFDSSGQVMDKSDSYAVIPCTRVETLEGTLIQDQYNHWGIKLEYSSRLGKIRVYYEPTCFEDNGGITRVMEANIKEIDDYSPDHLCVRINGIVDILMLNTDNGELVPLDPFLSMNELLLSSGYTFYGKFDRIMNADNYITLGYSENDISNSSGDFRATSRLSADLNNILESNQLNFHNLLA